QTSGSVARVNSHREFTPKEYQIQSCFFSKVKKPRIFTDETQIISFILIFFNLQSQNILEAKPKNPCSFVACNLVAAKSRAIFLSGLGVS
ncbi:hypothetical protein JXA70_21095, partial [candidate division KSB1 bacterium]|nr:hypothetical protein [candidate division KSB1 bacterium]